MATGTMASQSTFSKISHASSVETVNSLVLVGVGELCHARELFPAEAFAPPLAVEGLEGLKPHMLLVGPEANDGANALMQWLRESFPDAISRGYLRKFIFGISVNPEATKLLEEYVFRFEFDDKGKIRCTLPARQGTRPSVDTARTQVVKLMRSLTTLVRTLDEVPAERWLFCKMEYTDDCPQDYEPPHFEPAGDSAVGFFPTKPFAMRIGDVTTPYHSVELGCRSVLDTVDVVPGKGPTADNISRFETTRGAWTGDDAAAEEDNSDTAAQRLHVNTAELFTQTQDLRAHTPAASAAAADRSLLRHVQEVEQWAAGQRRVYLLDAMQRFNDVDADSVQEALAMLVARGVLCRTRDQDTYEVAAKGQGGGGGGGLDAEVEGQMGRLRVAPSNARHTELLSKAGGIHSVPGSSKTQSAACGMSTGRKRPLGMKRIGGESAGGVSPALWPTTQDSQLADGGEGVKRKKVSMVENPIHQSVKEQGVKEQSVKEQGVKEQGVKEQGVKEQGVKEQGRRAASPPPAACGRHMHLRSKAPKGRRLGAMRR